MVERVESAMPVAVTRSIQQKHYKVVIHGGAPLEIDLHQDGATRRWQHAKQWESAVIEGWFRRPLKFLTNAGDVHHG